MSKRNSAFFKAVGEQQKAVEAQGTAALQDGETVSPSNFDPVPPLDSGTVKRLKLPAVEPHRSVPEPRPGQATAAPSHRETVQPSHRSTVTAELNKTSFYLTQAQLDRLDELAYAYKRQTGKRINRNDIVRFLVEHARLETLLAEW